LSADSLSIGWGKTVKEAGLYGSKSVHEVATGSDANDADSNDADLKKAILARVVCLGGPLKTLATEKIPRMTDYANMFRRICDEFNEDAANFVMAKRKRVGDAKAEKIASKSNDFEVGLLWLASMQQNALAQGIHGQFTLLKTGMQQRPGDYFTVMLAQLDLQSLKMLQECMTSNREDARMGSISKVIFGQAFAAIDQHTKVVEACEAVVTSFTTMAFLSQFQESTTINWDGFRKLVNDKVDSKVREEAVAHAVAAHAAAAQAAGAQG
jgi:hypothetical protein